MAVWQKQQMQAKTGFGLSEILSVLQQRGSVIHTYIYIFYTHTHTHTHTHTDIYIFRFFSLMGYYKTLSRVPYAIQ